METYDAPFPGESQLIFSYFVAYRDMGPDRTLRALEVLEIKGRTRQLRQIGQWSSEFKWQVRTAAYDADVARAVAHQQREKQVEAVSSFITKDIEIATILQKDFLAWLSDPTEKPIEERAKWVSAYTKVREWIYDASLLYDDGNSDSDMSSEVTQQILKMLSSTE